MAYSLLFTNVASQIINSWPNKRLLGYGYLEQLKDILPGILLAVFMGICILPFGKLQIPVMCVIIVQVVMGALIYIACSIITKNDSFTYLLEIIKGILKKDKEE